MRRSKAAGKYGAVRTEVDGITFASAMEAAGYVLMERGRVERLRVASVAAECVVNCEPGLHCANWHDWLQDAVDGLQPGDLDPLEGGE